MSSNDGTTSINELLRRIVRKKTSATEKHPVRSKKQSTVRQLTDDRTIFQVAHDILETYVNSSAPRVRLHQQQHDGGHPRQMSLPIGTDAELKQLFTLQQDRVRRLNVLNETIVKHISEVVQSLKQEEKHISKWHKTKTASLEKTRREWQSRADEMSRVVEENNIPVRASIEREWRELARTMPQGHARDVIAAGIPLIGRSEISTLTGGGATTSMVSRVRRQQETSDSINNVHWKLRHAVEDVVDKHLDRLGKSAEMAIQSISSGAVRRARNVLDEAKARHDAADAMLNDRAQILIQNLRRRGVSYEHLMSHCAELTSRQRITHFNRLARLLTEQ